MIRDAAVRAEVGGADAAVLTGAGGSDRWASVLAAAHAAYRRCDPAEAVRLARLGVPASRGAEQRADALTWLGRYLGQIGDSQAAVEAFDEAALLVEHVSGPLRARVLSEQAAGRMVRTEYPLAARLAVRALRVARTAGDRAAEGRALQALGVCRAFSGQVEDGLRLLRLSLERAREVGDLNDLARAWVNVGFVMGSTRPARIAVESSLAALDEIGDLGLRLPSGGCLGVNAAGALWLVGEWAQFDVLADRLLDRIRSPHTEASLRVEWANIEHARGRDESARAHLGRASALVGAATDPWTTAKIQVGLAELAAGTDIAGALQAAKTGWDIAAVGTNDPMWLAEIGPRVIGVCATVAHLQGLTTGYDPRTVQGLAQTVAHTVERVIGDPPDQVLRAGRAAAAAELNRLHRRPDIASWATAAQSWHRLDWPYHYAYCRYREAEAAVAAGRPELAGPPAREAGRIAGELGATPLQAAAAALGLGAPPSSLPTEADRLPALSTLTPREHEILLLLARGRTNRLIARRLFISERTVAVHVSRVLAKLNASNRTEATAVATDLGLLTSGAGRGDVAGSSG